MDVWKAYSKTNSSIFSLNLFFLTTVNGSTIYCKPWSHSWIYPWHLPHFLSYSRPIRALSKYAPPPPPPPPIFLYSLGYFSSLLFGLSANFLHQLVLLQITEAVLAIWSRKEFNTVVVDWCYNHPSPCTFLQCDFATTTVSPPQMESIFPLNLGQLSEKLWPIEWGSDVEWPPALAIKGFSRFHFHPFGRQPSYKAAQARLLSDERPHGERWLRPSKVPDMRGKPSRTWEPTIAGS